MASAKIEVDRDEIEALFTFLEHIMEDKTNHTEAIMVAEHAIAILSDAIGRNDEIYTEEEREHGKKEN